MNFDDMLKTWRAQDEAPLYGVNRDLLQLVIRHEQADLRREVRLEHWTYFGVSALLLAFLAVALAVVYYDDDPRTVWDYVAAGVGMLAVVAGAGVLLVSRGRQARRERHFGNSLHEEIGRNLSLVDYQLSRVGRWEGALLAAAPMMLAACVIYWLIIQINNNRFGWFDGGMILVILVSTATEVSRSLRRAERELLPRRRRLNELLELLNKSE